MTNVPNIYAEFAAAISQGGDIPKGICLAKNTPAQLGLAVYRNNYRGNLHDALAGAYPVIVQLVGAAFFRRLARDFIATHPSFDANLFAYGAELDDFLSRYAATEQLAYLPDMASLEWAVQRAYLAADAPTLNLAELAAVPSDDYAQLHLQLHPACQVLHSIYPLAALWFAHQSAIAADFSLDLTHGGGALLVMRQHQQVLVEPLSAAEAYWLNATLAQHSVADANNLTLAHAADFDLSALLVKLAHLDALTGFYLGDSPCTI